MRLMQKKTASAAMENNVPTDVKDAKEILTVSVSPHLHSGRTTQNIMLDVIIALCPALIAGTVIFGVRSLLVAAVCMATAVLSEFLFNRICKKEQTVGDLSAVVTGLLLALNLPAADKERQLRVTLIIDGEEKTEYEGTLSPSGGGAMIIPVSSTVSGELECHIYLDGEWFEQQIVILN